MRAGAARLKNELDQRPGVETKIKLGSPGGLDVFVDGRKVFSYRERGRLPVAGDIFPVSA